MRVTAAASEAAQRRAAASLRAMGLAAGDRVAVCVSSSPEMLALILGALRTAVVPVVLNAGLLPAERDALVADAEPQVSVFDDETLAALVSEPSHEVELAPWPLARPMHYTSGTSGRPKGVWSGVLDEVSARALFEDEAELWGFSPGDVHLVCSPLHHSAAIRFSAGTLLRGGDVVLLPRFDASVAVEAMVDHAVTTTFCVPAHLQRMFPGLRSPSAPAPSSPMPKLPRLRLVAHAGAPCPDGLKRRALDAFPTGSVWEFYGSTEGQMTACSPEEWLSRPRTVGRARAGRTLTTDAAGTVWCRPPAWAAFEYWRDPAKTAHAWRDGWFTVGDAGRVDDDGYLFLDGRRDDLIISGGVNVYPVEVELALADVVGVDEIVVFGVTDERWGERVCAAVVGPASEADLRAAAITALAPYKRPKDVLRVAAADLPRTSTGKVKRSEVPAALGLEPAGGSG